MLLAGSESLEAFLEISYLGCTFASCPVAFECDPNGIQEFLFAQRLLEEFDSSSFHGPDRHPYVAMAGDEDDRYADLHPGKYGLKIESVRVRKPDVQNQTARFIRPLCRQEVRRRAESLAFPTDRLEQTFQALTNIGVVIDHIDD